MFFKKNLIELLLLLVTIISFAWISVHKQMIVPSNGDVIESLENQGEQEPVPGCSGAGNVPFCYDTVNKDFDPYAYDSNYILKTKVLPPLCPACPSTINNHHHGNNLFDGLVNEKGASVVKESTEINQSTSISNQSTNESTKNITNIENTTINNEINDPKKDKKDKKDKDKDNSKIMSDEILKRQQDFFDREEESKMARSSQCPPCPACERCPEPAFTCEKVINYRSPASKQYLPMPVLNDFSSFPSS